MSETTEADAAPGTHPLCDCPAACFMHWPEPPPEPLPPYLREDAKRSAKCASDGDDWDDDEHDRCSGCACPHHYCTGNTPYDVAHVNGSLI